MELKVDKVLIDRLALLAGLLLVFALGFAIRGHMLKFDYMFEFDSYMRARTVETMIANNGVLPEQDPLSFYPGETQRGLDKLNEWIAYYLYQALFGSSGPYNRELMFPLFMLLPAIYGSLTAVALYFFISEIAGKRAGWMASIMAAVMPALIYRTMAGWFEDHTLGFLWMVIGFYFLVKAFKAERIGRDAIANIALSGVFFGLFALTWGAFVIVPVIIGVYFLTQTYFDAVGPHLHKWLEKGKDRKVYLALSLFLVVVTGFAIPYWLTQDTFYLFKWTVIASVVAALASIALVFAKGLETPLQMVSRLKMHLVVIIASLALSLVVAVVYFGPSFVTDLGQSIIGRAENAFSINSCLEAGLEGGTENVTFALTGEQSPGCRQWYNKYNAFIPFAFLAILLAFYRVMTKPEAKGDLLLFAWVLVTMYFAYRQLKATYYFGLPVAASTGYFLGILLDKWSAGWRQVIAGLLALLTVTTGIAAATVFMPTNSPSIHKGDSLYEVTQWLKYNTPEGSRVMNWWGLGHILSFFSDRPVFTNNRQIAEALSIAGRFYLSQSEEEAMALANQYKPDYVLVEYWDLSGIESIAQYTYRTTNRNDPRIAQYSAYVAGCGISGGNVNCGGNTFSLQEYTSYYQEWNQVPNSFAGGEHSQFIYRSTDEDLQKGRAVLIVAGPLAQGAYDSGITTNNALLTRLVLKDETLEHFKLVFENGDYLIYKVNYD